MTVLMSTIVSAQVEYRAHEQAWDKIKLFFTFRAEKRAQLIEQMLERRESHYLFLIEEGKETQAQLFYQNTERLKTVLDKQFMGVNNNNG